MITRDQFPRLTADNYRVTSPATADYNCVGWAAGDVSRWWQPGVWWPIASASDDFGISALEKAFAALGYVKCADVSLEAGFEKVALFGTTFLYTHACKQLPSGKWSSKLGRDVDIEHVSPDNVAGGVYGEVVALMKRPRSEQPSAPP
jgi:hypothetical protein